MLIDYVQYLRNWLCNPFLQLSQHFEDVVFSENLIHSDDGFPIDDENISFVAWLNGFIIALIDSQGLEAVYDDVQQNVIHPLTVLNAWVGRGMEELT